MSTDFARASDGAASCMRSRIFLCLLSLVITIIGSVGSSFAQTTSSSVVDAKGNLRVPENYRTEYQFLGAWAVAAEDGNGSKEMHEVYASPGTIATYRRTGDFPDGTVLVKEIWGTETQPMTAGLSSHAQTLKSWFVMVRDSRNTHPGNKLWGDGWGWSSFPADTPTKTSSTDYTADCKGCHVPAQATHWVYVEGYRPLHR